MKNVMMNIRLGINTIKSDDFKRAWRDAMVDLRKLNMSERKELLDLKYAYNEQKRSYKHSYDLERKHVLVSLFTRTIAAYKAERIKDMLAKEQVETMYD